MVSIQTEYQYPPIKKAVNESKDTYPDEVSHSNGVTSLARGHSFHIILHPEHKAAIRSLADGQSHTFRDEQKKHWTATKSGSEVHFKGAGRDNENYRHSIEIKHIQD